MLTLAALLITVHPFTASAADVEPVIALKHTSNLFRGAPFNHQSERQQESFTAGVTITAGKLKAWEIDLTHGINSIDRGRWEGASELDVRFYPARYWRK